MSAALLSSADLTGHDRLVQANAKTIRPTEKPDMARPRQCSARPLEIALIMLRCLVDLIESLAGTEVRAA
jgi:hypothetical protein